MTVDETVARVLKMRNACVGNTRGKREREREREFRGGRLRASFLLLVCTEPMTVDETVARVCVCCNHVK